MPVPRAADKFVLRLPDYMRDQIAALAQSNQRSMNSEIVFHLSKVLASEEKIAANKAGLEGAVTPARP